MGSLKLQPIGSDRQGPTLRIKPVVSTQTASRIHTTISLEVATGYRDIVGIYIPTNGHVLHRAHCTLSSSFDSKHHHRSHCGSEVQDA
jgi:hypothetical protein